MFRKFNLRKAWTLGPSDPGEECLEVELPGIGQVVIKYSNLIKLILVDY